MGNRTRIRSEQRFESVLLLLNLLLQLRKLGRGGVEKLLGLTHVRKRSRASTLKHLCELDGVLADLDGLPGNLSWRSRARSWI